MAIQKVSQTASLITGTLVSAAALFATAEHVRVTSAEIIVVPVVVGAVAHAATYAQDWLAVRSAKRSRANAAIIAADEAALAASRAALVAEVATAVTALQSVSKSPAAITETISAINGEIVHTQI